MKGRSIMQKVLYFTSSIALLFAALFFYQVHTTHTVSNDLATANKQIKTLKQKLEDQKLDAINIPSSSVTNTPTKSKQQEKTVPTKETKQPLNQQENVVKPIQNNATETFITDTFTRFFNYNNKNYLTRYDDLSKAATPEVVESLKGAMSQTTPKITFQNTVKDMQVYMNPKDDTTALVIVKSSYKVEGADPVEQNGIYRVKVSKDQQNLKIVSLEYGGNFDPIVHS